MEINRTLIEKGLNLIHEVLVDRQIQEGLRIKLIEWRSDIEFELEKDDNETKDKNTDP